VFVPDFGCQQGIQFHPRSRAIADVHADAAFRLASERDGRGGTSRIRGRIGMARAARRKQPGKQKG